MNGFVIRRVFVFASLSAASASHTAPRYRVSTAPDYSTV